MKTMFPLLSLSMSITYVRVFVCLPIIVVQFSAANVRYELVVCEWRMSQSQCKLKNMYTSCMWLRTVILNGVGNPVLCILLNSSWAHNIKWQNRILKSSCPCSAYCSWCFAWLLVVVLRLHPLYFSSRMAHDPLGSDSLASSSATV